MTFPLIVVLIAILSSSSMFASEACRWSGYSEFSVNLQLSTVLAVSVKPTLIPGIFVIVDRIESSFSDVLITIWRSFSERYSLKKGVLVLTFNQRKQETSYFWWQADRENHGKFHPWETGTAEETRGPGWRTGGSGGVWCLCYCSRIPPVLCVQSIYFWTWSWFFSVFQMKGPAARPCCRGWAGSTWRATRWRWLSYTEIISQSAQLMMIFEVTL